MKLSADANNIQKLLLDSLKGTAGERINHGIDSGTIPYRAEDKVRRPLLLLGLRQHPVEDCTGVVAFRIELIQHLSGDKSSGFILWFGHAANYTSLLPFNQPDYLYHSPVSLFPAEVIEFFFGANEFDSAVIEQDAAAFWVVIIEGK